MVKSDRWESAEQDTECCLDSGGRSYSVVETYGKDLKKMLLSILVMLRSAALTLGYVECESKAPRL